MDRFQKLKSPFYKPVQFWYDPGKDQIWKLKLGCLTWRLEEPTLEEERAVREFNDLL